jgi:hypothetical protein
MGVPLYKECMQEIMQEIEEKTNIEAFKSMKEILNKSFGEDFNQIVRPTFELLDRFVHESGVHSMIIASSSKDTIKKYIRQHCTPGYAIIIHFPELTITNSRKMSHVIRDLYVRFRVREDGKFYHGIQGLRTTFTEEEARSGYVHSHLHGMDPMNVHFDVFCLGTGEIQQPLTLLAQNFDPINFTMLCLHLKNYVVWESLEGNPFRHMSSIGNPQAQPRNRLNSDNSKRIANQLLQLLMKENTQRIKAMLKVQLTPYELEVHPTDELELWEAVELEKIPLSVWGRNMNWESLLCYKDEQGNYIGMGQANLPPMVIQTTPVLQFKGQDKYLTVIKNDTTIKKEKYANPNITSELCRKLSRSFTKTALVGQGSKEHIDPGIHIKEAKPADILPMQPGS